MSILRNAVNPVAGKVAYGATSAPVWRGGGPVIRRLLQGLTLTRSSAAWAWGSDQLLDEYAADELRRDHDPATGAFRGVLVEESRTNELLDNRDLSTGHWITDAGISVSQDETGIDGALNAAWTVTAANGGGVFGDKFNQNRSVADNTEPNTHLWHIGKDNNQTRFPALQLQYLEGTDGNPRIRITIDTATGDSHVVSNDNAGTHTVKDAGNYWEITLSMQNTGNGNTLLNYRCWPTYGDSLTTENDPGAGSIVYDFGQFELNSSFATSPIETGGSVVTRAADVLEGAFNESSGTLHFVGEHKGGDGVLWQADDTTINERIRLEVSSGDVRLVVDDGGTNQATLNAGALASDGTYAVAFRFGASDFAISLDGATAVAQSSGTVPTVTTQRFGRDTNATAGLNWYKTANYRESLLTNSELEALTA